ncbi:MAG TPA: thioredoxin [Candidatus Borkfalkia excrementavium]|uniref:Thioredoxin n=1 Tax=Candidatus Borkfalkia excrementavium TaxID=2838505 RepID=A0A9D2CEV2_9FIRM|nr:thioredoxin [Candidatus Borkfalkia excrementavium]
MVKEFDTAAFRAAMQEKKALVVDFWATWCGPCRMLAPVMEELSGEYEGKADFVKIDVDENPDLAREYSIMSIPCVMVFKDGALAGKNVGFVPKAAMKEFIDKNL